MGDFRPDGGYPARVGTGRGATVGERERRVMAGVLLGAAALVELAINVLTLALSLFVLRWTWVRRDALLALCPAGPAGQS
jgi:hypothetical protein